MDVYYKGGPCAVAPLAHANHRHCDSLFEVKKLCSQTSHAGLQNNFKTINPWHLSSIFVIRWWLIFSVDRWVMIASVMGPLFIFHIKLLTCTLAMRRDLVLCGNLMIFQYFCFRKAAQKPCRRWSRINDFPVCLQCFQ